MTYNPPILTLDLFEPLHVLHIRFGKQEFVLNVAMLHDLLRNTEHQLAGSYDRYEEEHHG